MEVNKVALMLQSVGGPLSADQVCLKSASRPLPTPLAFRFERDWTESLHSATESSPQSVAAGWAAGTTVLISDWNCLQFCFPHWIHGKENNHLWARKNDNITTATELLLFEKPYGLLRYGNKMLFFYSMTETRNDVLERKWLQQSSSAISSSLLTLPVFYTLD